MPVRCPACHSDQTKPAPARTPWERISGLWGRRAYFCEDCYRRFIPSKSGQPAPEPAQAPAPEEAASSTAPAAEALPEVSMAIPAQNEAPPSPVQGPPPEPPSPAQTPAQEGMAPVEDEESLIVRMRRQMSEEAPAEEPLAAPEEPPRPAWPLTPAKMAWIGGGVVLAMVLVLWYRSSLDRPPQPPQAPTTRVKISEPTPPAPAQPPAATQPSPAAQPPAPAPQPLATAQMPIREAPLPPEKPAPRAEPAPKAVEPPRAEPAPRPAARPPAPKTPAAQPKAAPKTASAPSRPAPSQGNYAVQFGAFSQAARAQVLAAKLQAKGVKVQVLSSKSQDGKTWHKVRSGGLPTQAEAQRVQRKLEQVSGVKGMVVRIKP